MSSFCWFIWVTVRVTKPINVTQYSVFSYSHSVSTVCPSRAGTGREGEASLDKEVQCEVSSSFPDWTMQPIDCCVCCHAFRVDPGERGAEV